MPACVCLRYKNVTVARGPLGTRALAIVGRSPLFYGRLGKNASANTATLGLGRLSRPPSCEIAQGHRPLRIGPAPQVFYRHRPSSQLISA